MNIHLTNDSYSTMAEIQSRKILDKLGESISGQEMIWTGTRPNRIWFKKDD